MLNGLSLAKDKIVLRVNGVSLTERSWAVYFSVARALKVYACC
jgi:hypothetical protein